METFVAGFHAFDLVYHVEAVNHFAEYGTAKTLWVSGFEVQAVVVGGVDEQGNPIEISDPLLPVIQKAVQSSAEGKARVQSLLAIKAIFGDVLPDNSWFTAKVTEAYLSLLAHGAKATVAKYSVK